MVDLIFIELVMLQLCNSDNSVPIVSKSLVYDITVLALPHKFKLVQHQI